MQYLQPRFTIEKPAKVFGCAACIYGEKHGYEHTYLDGCQYAEAARQFQADVAKHMARPARKGRSLVSLTIPKQ